MSNLFLNFLVQKNKIFQNAIEFQLFKNFPQTTHDVKTLFGRCYDVKTAIQRRLLPVV